MPQGAPRAARLPRAPLAERKAARLIRAEAAKVRAAAKRAEERRKQAAARERERIREARRQALLDTEGIEITPAEAEAHLVRALRAPGQPGEVMATVATVKAIREGRGWAGGPQDVRVSVASVRDMTDAELREAIRRGEVGGVVERIEGGEGVE